MVSPTLEPDELSARPAADDHLVGAELEHPALRQSTFPREPRARGLDAAHRHVGRLVGRRLLRQIDDDVELRRRQRRLAVAPDARRLLDDVDRRSRARPLVISLSAPLRMTSARLGRAGSLHRRREPGGDRQHRHEHDHDAGDADDGDGRRAEPRRNRAEVQRQHRERCQLKPIARRFDFLLPDPSCRREASHDLRQLASVPSQRVGDPAAASRRPPASRRRGAPITDHQRRADGEIPRRQR